VAFHGDVHTVAGTGIVPIGNPYGLSIELANIPPWASVRYGAPDRYPRLAWAAVGNGDGFLPDVALPHVRTLLLPLPPGMTLLGLTLVDGVTATVTELLLLPPATGMLGWAQPGALQLGRPV